jgi:uncharacterized phage-associated protein
MTFDHRVLEDAITLIVARSPRVVTRTSLVKLLYFVDLRGWERRGRSLTELPWRWHYYGPYADAVAEVVGDLEAADELIVEPNTSYFGTAEYRILSGKNAALYPVLTVDDEHLISDVLEQFGRFSASTLGKLSYQTAPMEQVDNRGDLLDFSMYSGRELKPAAYQPDVSAEPSPKMDALYSSY